MVDNAPARQAPQGSVSFNLWAIVLILTGLALALAYVLDAASRSSRTVAHRLDTETVLTRALGGHELEIPLAWFRDEEQPASGFARQIELRLALPLGVDGRSETVDVTLLPRSRVRPSSVLLDGVYLHLFQAEQLSGPPGLVGKPLQPAGGYESETVWYDALSADPFVAKCSRLTADAGEVQCVRTVFLATGIAAIYAFPEHSARRTGGRSIRRSGSG